MTKRLNITESISKWITGINSIELDKRNPTPTTDNECARCQMLEVKIERLQKLMQGWDKTEAEIKTEAVNEFMYKVIQNQFYSKESLLSFYRTEYPKE